MIHLKQCFWRLTWWLRRTFYRYFPIPARWIFRRLERRRLRRWRISCPTPVLWPFEKGLKEFTRCCIDARRAGVEGLGALEIEMEELAVFAASHSRPTPGPPIPNDLSDPARQALESLEKRIQKQWQK